MKHLASALCRRFFHVGLTDFHSVFHWVNIEKADSCACPDSDWHSTNQAGVEKQTAN